MLNEVDTLITVVKTKATTDGLGLQIGTTCLLVDCVCDIIVVEGQ